MSAEGAEMSAEVAIEAAKPAIEAAKPAIEAAKSNETAALITLSGDAKEKLAKKGGDVSKITKREMCSILLSCYGVLVKESTHAKPALMEMLVAKIAEMPGNVLVSPVAAAPNASPAAPVAACTALAAATTNVD
jgi:hypothetical protein